MKRRTQIYLDQDVYRNLRRAADTRNLSISEVIRQRIGRPPQTRRPQKNAREVLAEFAKLGATMDWKGTPRDISTRIDEFLYGKPRQ